MTNVSKDVEKWEHLYTLCGNVNWPLWKTVWRFSQKNENRTTVQPSNATPGYISKKNTLI